MHNITHAAFSPDGRHLYVAANGDNALAIYAVDSVNGGLEFVTLLVDSVNGVDGLEGIFVVCVSPDGKFVYTGLIEEKALTIFSRDSVTGTCSFIEKIDSIIIDSLNYFEQFSSIVISPDGKFLYTYSLAYASILTFKQDTKTGRLTRVGNMRIDSLSGKCKRAPATMIISSDGKNIYTVRVGYNLMHILNRDILSGFITGKEQVQIGDERSTLYCDWDDGEVATILINSKGRDIYVAEPYGRKIHFFSRDTSDGSLVKIGEYGVGNVTTLTLSEDESYCYSCDQNFSYPSLFLSNNTTVFKRDKFNGQLTKLVDINGLIGHYYGKVYGGDIMRFEFIFTNPNNNLLYGISRNGEAIGVFLYDSITNTLTRNHCSFETDSSINGLYGSQSIVMSPDDKHIYVIGSKDNAISIFERNALTGTVSYINLLEGGKDSINNFNSSTLLRMSNSGKYLFIGSSIGYPITVLRRENVTGSLSFIQNVGQNVSSAFTLTLDDRHLYAIDSNTISIFQIDTTTGKLTFVDKVKDSLNNVFNPDFINCIVSSNDNKNIYVSVNDKHEPGLGIYTLSREINSGNLSIQNRVWGLFPDDQVPNILTCTHKGNYFYAISISRGTNGKGYCFIRDIISGELTGGKEYVVPYHMSVGPKNIAISHDDNRLYFAANGCTKEANSSTHYVSFLQTNVLNPDNGDCIQTGLLSGSIPSLNRINSMVESSDGMYFYTAAYRADALSIFRVIPDTIPVSIQNDPFNIQKELSLLQTPHGVLINLHIDKPANLTMFIYNVAGRLVQSKKVALNHQGYNKVNWTWDKALPSGVFIIYLDWENQRKFRKFVINR